MNASPAGDTLPVLIAYETEVELASVRGARLVAFNEFYKGYRKTAAASDEILTKFIIKKGIKGERASFVKIGTRKAQAISKICACFRHYSSSESASSRRVETQCVGSRLRPNNNAGDFIIAYGSVAPTPIRCPKTELLLSGKKLTRDLIDKAVKMAREETAPINDIRSTKDYRVHVAGTILKRFISDLK